MVTAYFTFAQHTIDLRKIYERSPNSLNPKKMKWFGWLIVASIVITTKAWADDRALLSIKLPDLKAGERIAGFDMTVVGAAIVSVAVLNRDWTYQIDNGSAETSIFQAQAYHGTSWLILPEDSGFFRNMLMLKMSELLCKPLMDLKSCVTLSLSGNIYVVTNPATAETRMIKLGAENFLLKPAK